VQIIQQCEFPAPELECPSRFNHSKNAAVQRVYCPRWPPTVPHINIYSTGCRARKVILLRRFRALEPRSRQTASCSAFRHTPPPSTLRPDDSAPAQRVAAIRFPRFSLFTGTSDGANHSPRLSAVNCQYKRSPWARLRTKCSQIFHRPKRLYQPSEIDSSRFQFHPTTSPLRRSGSPTLCSGKSKPTTYPLHRPAPLDLWICSAGLSDPQHNPRPRIEPVVPSVNYH